LLLLWLSIGISLCAQLSCADVRNVDCVLLIILYHIYIIGSIETSFASQCNRWSINKWHISPQIDIDIQVVNQDQEGVEYDIRFVLIFIIRTFNSGHLILARRYALSQLLSSVLRLYNNQTLYYPCFSIVLFFFLWIINLL
jgi:hypothetical protein